MILIVNGLDITAKICIDGYKWASNDLHDESSGRTMDGVMHITRIGTKDQLEINCVPVDLAAAQQILRAVKILPEFPVTYESPEEGVRTATFYCSARNCELLKACRGQSWWKNIKFTLTEC